MNSFDRLKLRKHKGLNGAELTGLSKINVFCGPNSSGKTTALECINEPKLRLVGVPTSRELATNVEKESFVGRSWQQSVFAEYYRDSVAAVITRNPTIFQDEIDALWDAVNTQFNERRRGRGSLDFGDQFKRAIESKFVASQKVVMIPAKRILPSTSPLSSGAAINSNGEGVLNFLFRAKNQDPASPAWRALDRIATGFSTITSGHDFETFLRDNNEVELRFKSPTSNWLFGDDCGLGFRDILILLYFAVASTYDVILIEEPENHLHPEIQRQLINYLRNNSEKQFFISTHSSVFLNTHVADRVFTCRMKGSVQIENATSRASVLTELGYSVADNLVSDVIILCEGPKDKGILEEFIQKLGMQDKKRIKVWPLGGDIMDQLDLEVFTPSSKVAALIDSDPGSAHIRRRFVDKCQKLNIPVHQLKRYAMENYLSLRAIQIVMGTNIKNSVSTLDDAARVSDQLGCDIKRNNTKIAKEMQVSEIEGTDLAQFLQSILEAPI